MTLTGGQNAVGVYHRLNLVELNSVRQHLLSLREWTRQCEDDQISAGKWFEVVVDGVGKQRNVHMTHFQMGPFL